MFLAVATLASARADQGNCTDCHTVLEQAMLHEAAVESCDGCHAPHGKKTGNPYRLHKPVKDLCFDCHDRKTMRIAPDGRGHVVENHPTYLSRDPMYERGDPAIKPREFDCVSCHNPHASKMPALFRYDYSPTSIYRGSRCAVCHWEFEFPGEAPFPPVEGESKSRR